MKSQIESSLSFPSDLVRGVSARSSVERRGGESREMRAAAFSHAHGHFRVSRVFLNGLR